MCTLPVHCDPLEGTHIDLLTFVPTEASLWALVAGKQMETEIMKEVPIWSVEIIELFSLNHSNEIRLLADVRLGVVPSSLDTSSECKVKAEFF